MDRPDEDRFEVYVRADRRHSPRPDHAERLFASCATYAEARRVQQRLHGAAHDSIIRYIGPAGGGD